jgi:hypothetical protein
MHPENFYIVFFFQKPRRNSYSFKIMTVDQNEEFAGGINRAEMCLNLTPSLR